MREYIPHSNNIRKLFFIVKVQKWSEVFIWWLCYLDIPCTHMNSTKDKNYDQHIYQKLQMSCQHELLIGFASSIKCSFQVFLNAAKVCLLTENRERNLIFTEWQKMCIQLLKYLSILFTVNLHYFSLVRLHCKKWPGASENTTMENEVK